MPTKTKTVIKETEEVSDLDNRAVLAYRVAQLEKTTSEGLAVLNSKLDDLAHNFATKAELESEKRAAVREHADIREDIAAVKKSVDEITSWKDAIVGRIALGAVLMLVMMVLAFYGLDKFVN